MLGRKDVVQGSRRKLCKINFEKSKNRKVEKIQDGKGESLKKKYDE